MNPLHSIPAIDVHGHYGQYVGETGNTLVDTLYSGDADTVVRRASAVKIVLTIVSPLSALKPRFHADAAAGNREAANVVSRTAGLKQYVVIDPLRPETYAQAAEMLAQPQCVGIKIHPEEHGYPIRQHDRDATLLFNPDYGERLREAAAGFDRGRILAAIRGADGVLAGLPRNLNPTLLVSDFVAGLWS